MMLGLEKVDRLDGEYVCHRIDDILDGVTAEASGRRGSVSPYDSAVTAASPRPFVGPRATRSRLPTRPSSSGLSRTIWAGNHNLWPASMSSNSLHATMPTAPSFPTSWALKRLQLGFQRRSTGMKSARKALGRFPRRDVNRRATRIDCGKLASDPTPTPTTIAFAGDDEPSANSGHTG